VVGSVGAVRQSSLVHVEHHLDDVACAGGVRVSGRTTTKREREREGDESHAWSAASRRTCAEAGSVGHVGAASSGLTPASGRAYGPAGCHVADVRCRRHNAARTGV
jgi:hypothetical protein